MSSRPFILMTSRTCRRNMEMADRRHEMKDRKSQATAFLIKLKAAGTDSDRRITFFC